MERIFKKDFKFSVDAYEEYQNQKCISSGDIDAVIYCHIFGNKAYFVITGMEGLNIDSIFDFNIEHPHSNMLKPGGMVVSPRIQYMSDSLGTDTKPYICLLFCNYGQIVTVRFGFADFSVSSVFPWPKRIYEFSGDMEELDVLSEESRQILNEYLPQERVLSFGYDKYCIMIETSDFNPLNINTDTQMNEGILWHDLVDDFEREIIEFMPRYLQGKLNIRTVIQVMVIDQVENLFKRLGYVPKVMVDAIIYDIYIALLRTPYSDFLDDIEDIKYGIYYSLTHR